MTKSAPPRVLIITVNPLSATSNNGKTYASLFKDFPPSKVAQLYFHREIPSSGVAGRYYQISEGDYFRWAPRRSRNLGRIATPTPVTHPHGNSSRLAQRAKRSDLIRLIRQAAWTRLDFNAPQLREWICNFDPQMIFFCPGDANYLVTPTLNLANRLGIPITYFVTDDYVLPAARDSWAGHLTRVWNRRSFLRTCTASAWVMTIGKKMSETYEQFFGVESTPIMNLVDLPPTLAGDSTIDTQAPEIAYVGGLHLSRWKTLLEVANGLARITTETFHPLLVVHASPTPVEAVSALVDHNNIDFRGPISAKEVPQVMREADILLHVESFEDNARLATALSISTKIPEYMVSGRAILAVGPPEVASMEYLTELDAAVIITEQDHDVIDKSLTTVLTNRRVRARVIQNALEAVAALHDGRVQRQNFMSQLERISHTQGCP